MISASGKPTSFICKVAGENNAGHEQEGAKERVKERVKRVRVGVLRKRGCGIGHKFFHLQNF